MAAIGGFCLNLINGSRLFGAGFEKVLREEELKAGGMFAKEVHIVEDRAIIEVFLCSLQAAHGQLVSKCFFVASALMQQSHKHSRWLRLEGVETQGLPSSKATALTVVGSGWQVEGPGKKEGQCSDG